MKLAGDIH